MQDLDRIRERYSIAAQIVKILLEKIALHEWKAGYRDDQPRGPDGKWIIGGGNYIVSKRHTTGDKRVDSITEKIVTVLDTVLSNIGPGRGSLYGTHVHTETANILREMNIPGIGREGIEQSFSFGDLVRYGFNGSVRTDAILRNEQSGEILAVWDIKTGNERLYPSRVAEIRRNLNISDDIPVIEVNVNLGINVKDCEYGSEFAIV